MALPAITPLDARAYTLLAEAGFGDDLFNPRQHQACELVEHYTVALAGEVLDGLGVHAQLTRPRTVDELVTALDFVPTFRGPLTWLLDLRLWTGALAREGVRYRIRPATVPGAPAELRAAGLALDPAYAPAYALVDEAAAIYPRVARGETSGERALFLRAALWAAYFSNTNGYYALTNHVAARTAARYLPPSGGIVVEVGAGLGSASLALLDALAARGTVLARYHLTEPVPFFRRRAERALAAAWPTVAVASTALDLNAPWVAQDVLPASAQLVWGVNVFHLARDLEVTLHEARAALAPGGWLVVGEGLRPAPGRPVAAEFPFQLLESFLAVRLDPERRPTPGFLTAAQWQAALLRAGFADVAVLPDVARLGALYPGFLGGAICGRRP